MLIPDIALLKPALLTVAIELPLFFLCGYRQGRELVTFFGVNLVSNLLLNESLPDFRPEAGWYLCLLTGELLVVAVEFFFMEYIVSGAGGRLLKAVAFTNAVSLGLGLLILF